MLAFTIGACSRAPKQTPLPAGTVVLAFGDSVTFGTGAGAGEDYPSRLAAITGWQVINRGIPGDTAQAARQRIVGALEETQPKLVIIEIGGNDFLRQRAEAAIKDDVRAILQSVKQAGVPVALIATPRFSLVGAAIGSLPDAALYGELAKEEKISLIPGVFSGVLSDPALKADAVHPNANGYRTFADGVAAGLAKAGFLGKR